MAERRVHCKARDIHDMHDMHGIRDTHGMYDIYMKSVTYMTYLMRFVADSCLILTDFVPFLPVTSWHCVIFLSYSGHSDVAKLLP